MFAPQDQDNRRAVARRLTRNMSRAATRALGNEPGYRPAVPGREKAKDGRPDLVEQLSDPCSRRHRV